MLCDCLIQTQQSRAEQSERSVDGERGILSGALTLCVQKIEECEKGKGKKEKTIEWISQMKPSLSEDWIGLEDGN